MNTEDKLRAACAEAGYPDVVINHYGDDDYGIVCTPDLPDDLPWRAWHSIGSKDTPCLACYEAGKADECLAVGVPFVKNCGRNS